MQAYYTGQSVRLSASFTDPETELPYDPATVSFTCRPPSGVALSKTYPENPDVVRDGVGEYHLDLIAAEPGEWHYRAQGAGGGQAADECMFVVTATEV
jgi:hypothetical protein